MTVTRPELEASAPPSFLCPIGRELMGDPVSSADGHSYERANIERWLAESRLSPVTGSQLPHGYLTPNHALRNAIEEWVAQQEDQPKPAAEEPPPAAPPHLQLELGEPVIYVRSEDEAPQAAQVLSIHREAAGPPYYTVRLLVSGDERQTEASRLRLPRTTDDDGAAAADLALFASEPALQEALRARAYKAECLAIETAARDEAVERSRREAAEAREAKQQTAARRAAAQREAARVAEQQEADERQAQLAAMREEDERTAAVERSRREAAAARARARGERPPPPGGSPRAGGGAAARGQYDTWDPGASFQQAAAGASAAFERGLPQVAEGLRSAASHLDQFASSLFGGGGHPARPPPGSPRR